MSLAAADINAVRLGGLLTGVFVTQIVNSLSGSMGSAAFFSAFGTAVHMVGTYLGGWPTERFGARRVLAVSTFLRGVVLAGLPLAMAFGFLSLSWAMACYTAEALIRGYVDTSVHTIPLELAGTARNCSTRSTPATSWPSRSARWWVR